MTTDTRPITPVTAEETEERAITAEQPPVEAAPLETAEPEARESPLRLALIAACPTLAAAVMTGGLFIGTGGRAWAIIMGLAGVALAWRVGRIRQPLLLYPPIFGTREHLVHHAPQ